MPGRNTHCWYDSKGGCTKVSCPFIHERSTKSTSAKRMPPPPSPSPPPPTPSPPPSLTNPSNLSICVSWDISETCSKGNSCEFLHASPIQQTSDEGPNNRQAIRDDPHQTVPNQSLRELLSGSSSDSGTITPTSWALTSREGSCQHGDVWSRQLEEAYNLPSHGGSVNFTPPSPKNDPFPWRRDPYAYFNAPIPEDTSSRPISGPPQLMAPSMPGFQNARNTYNPSIIGRVPYFSITHFLAADSIGHVGAWHIGTPNFPILPFPHPKRNDFPEIQMSHFTVGSGEVGRSVLICLGMVIGALETLLQDWRMFLRESSTGPRLNHIELVTSDIRFYHVVMKSFENEPPFNHRLVVLAMIGLFHVLIAFQKIGVTVCFKCVPVDLIEDAHVQAMRCMIKNRGCPPGENQIYFVKGAMAIPDLEKDGWPFIYGFVEMSQGMGR